MMGATAFFEVGTLTDAHFGDDPDAAKAWLTDDPVKVLENVAGHAAMGCASAAASGDNCGSGAIGAAVSGIAGPVILSQGAGLVAGTALTAASGALGAGLSGGDPALGAVTGAWGYLFNTCGNNPSSCLNPQDKGQGMVDMAVGGGKWMWVPQGDAADRYTTALLTTDVGSGGGIPISISSGGSFSTGNGYGLAVSCSTNGSCYAGYGLVGGASISGSVGLGSYSSGYPYGAGIQISGAAGEGFGFRGSVFVGLEGYSISGGFGPVAGMSIGATGGYRAPPTQEGN